VKRRVVVSALLCAPALISAACSRSEPQLQTPSFSASELHKLLESLRLAFERKAHHVSASLLPPLPESSLRASCRWFPEELPPELVSLYSWRGGQANGAWDEEFPFLFRDCGFSSPEVAAESYKSMMETYGSFPGDHDLLKRSFPFAEFNGGWLVMPVLEFGFRGFHRPVVSVHQDVAVWFHTITSVVKTCVEWVSDPGREQEGLQEADEMRIWKKHNPGIFAGAT